MLSSRSPGRSGNRGRAREREKPTKKDAMPRHRSRERDAARSNGRRHSVSPRRNDRSQAGADKGKRLPSQISSKLRMDESDRRDRAHGSSRKGTGELDRVMKKAREDQDRSHWDKRVLEAEDRDPNRWGHSGFKEMYTKDFNRRDARRSSPGPRARRNIRSPDRRARQPPRRSRSDSRRRRQREREASNRRPASSRIDARDDRSRLQREKNGTIKSRLGAKPIASRATATKRLSGPRRRSESKSSRSRSRSPANKRKRVSTGSAGRSKKRSDSKSSYSSRSPSSSTGSSSEDDDVLEIHAGRRRGSHSSSVSSYTSSDSRSVSSSSGKSKGSRSRSSSDSGSTSGSDSDVSGKIRSSAAKKTTNGAKDTRSRPGTSKKRPPTTSTSSKASKVAKKVTAAQKSKPTNASGDSDSDSGSSSDSDSEPRMTLSERFSKLTQTSTDKDKREFAKPMLAASEIDTKLKVVKDLKNADTKIYVDGVPQSPKTISKTAPKERARSPGYRHGERDQRHPSAERRDYFDRMERDGPSELPENWGDARVRFEYYRDRGCFDDRPLTFEEYTKWEQWYYQYREWLENEGYFAQAEGGGGGSRYGAEDWNRYGRSGGSGARRVEQVPMSRRPQFAGRDDDRSIGRAPGGSLVVNIRQGATTTGIRGRRVGIVGNRNNR